MMLAPSESRRAFLCWRWVCYAQCIAGPVLALLGLLFYLSPESVREAPWLLTVLIALASSTDNFAVGLSVALAGSALPALVNVVVAIFNAAGALLSDSLGGFLGAAAPTLAPLAAASIFAYIAHEEYSSWQRGEDESPLARLAADPRQGIGGLICRLALPMSLNNLAGGVASGAASIPPWAACTATFVASLAMMHAGHTLGRFAAGCVRRCVDTRVIAVLIFLGVAALQVREAAHSLSEPSVEGNASRI